MGGKSYYVPVKPKEAGWSNYFERIDQTTVWRCRAPGCDYVNDRGERKRTSVIEKHLKDAHPDLYERRQQAFAGYEKPTNASENGKKRTSQIAHQNGEQQPKAKKIRQRLLQMPKLEGVREEEEYGEMDNNDMDGGSQLDYFLSGTVLDDNNSTMATDHQGYELQGHSSSTFKADVTQPYLNGGNSLELMAAAFENDEDPARNDGEEEDPMLDSRLKMAKIAFFEAQAELAIAQANESRARETESKARTNETRARAKTEIAKESESRANERVANIRAKLLELEYQEKIRRSARSSASASSSSGVNNNHHQ